MKLNPILASLLIAQQLLLPFVARGEARERPEIVRDRLKSHLLAEYLPPAPAPVMPVTGDATVAPEAAAAPAPANAVEAGTFDAAAVKRFENDLYAYLSSLQGLTRASGKSFIDEDEFKQWWNAAGRAHFMNRAALAPIQGLSLEAFVMQAWLAHLAELARDQRDLTGFEQQLADFRKSPFVDWGLWISGGIVFGAGGWLLEQVKNSIVNGPGGDIMRNIFDPLTKHPIQKAHQISSRVFNKPSEWLSNRFNPPNVGIPVDEETMETAREGAKQVKAKLADLRTELLRMNFAGMSEKSLVDMRARQQAMWTSALSTYNQTIPEALRRGRDITQDAVAFRPLHFIYTASIFDTNYQVHKDAFRRGQARLLAKAGPDSPLARELAKLEIEFRAVYEARLAANEKVTPTRAHLDALDRADLAYRLRHDYVITLGADPSELKNWEENLTGRIRARKQIVANMVASIFNDAAFREFQEEMAMDIRQATRALQANLGLDFYIDEYQPEIVELFHKMDIMLDDAIIHGDSIVRARAQLVRQVEAEERVQRQLAESGRPGVSAKARAEGLAAAPSGTGKCSGFARLIRHLPLRRDKAQR